ncbi:MAG: phospho-sugar mutase [Turneriella sp.]|nr:phospho-sugar mutase [Turneriella sp.]
MKKIPMRSFSEALALAESWTQPPFDKDTVSAVKALLTLPDREKETAILDRFGYDLSFGTAGMRAIMDVGTARINEYTIARVSHAVAQVLKSGKTKPAVVIGYDGRKDSAKFARIAQLKFLAQGVDVFAFDRILPTPLIPFAVRRLKADCGVMITSSHNAAPYNGYKVYAANGAQILSPFDTDVMAAMEKIPFAGNDTPVTATGKLTLLDEKLLKDYVDWVTSEVDFAPKENRALKIVFTPLHGAAGAMMNAVFYRSGFKNFLPVPQQYEPRPDFATVKAPNPENKDSLDMAIAMAKEENADLILATDGDGDRVGVAYKTANGYTSLTGNQIGTLFLYYLLAKQREKKADLSKTIALSSLVSTPLTRVICEKFGVRHFETLTGFKNMGNKADAILTAEPGTRMVLAFEEAFGVTVGDSRDKDGIVSCLLGAHIAADIPTTDGRPPAADKDGILAGGIEIWLEKMYAECGYASEDAVEKEFPGAEGIAAMGAVVEKLRQNPLTEFLGSPVTSLRDFKKGTEIRAGKEIPIQDIPAQNLIYYTNAAGDWFAIRPSGTEPKVKAYVGIRQKSTERLTALCHFAAGLLE